MVIIPLSHLHKRFSYHIFFFSIYWMMVLILCKKNLFQEVTKRMGEIIAKSCLEKGITKVAFDRGGYPYHDHVQALAEAAREHGDVSSIGACRPRIFFINGFLCFLEDEWLRNGEGRERRDATSRRR